MSRIILACFLVIQLATRLFFFFNIIKIKKNKQNYIVYFLSGSSMKDSNVKAHIALEFHAVI